MTRVPAPFEHISEPTMRVVEKLRRDCGVACPQVPDKAAIRLLKDASREAPPPERENQMLGALVGVILGALITFGAFAFLYGLVCWGLDEVARLHGEVR